MASVAGDTFKVVPPVTAFRVAEMLVLPTLTAVASPALLMVATPVLVEAQVTEPVRFWVLASEYVPVAVNCWVAPFWIVGLAGVTAIDTNVGAVMVMLKSLVVVITGLPESVTRTVKLKVPAANGVPDITPLLLKVNPVGSPPVSDQLYVGVPPLASRLAE
jgi:hypothetical protein